MRVLSYTVLHYGKDYLDYALRSVQSNVDRSIIVYTPHPSHDHKIDINPPETLEQLQQSVTIDCDWYKTEGIFYEGRQRDEAVRICESNGADLILVVDYDEVWSTPTLSRVLNYVWQQNKARNWLINFTHLWKSFNWCCRDQGWPVRIIDTRHKDRTAYVPKEFGEIYHFGYAVTDRIMQYKWKIHGHKNDLREGWLTGQWQAWLPVNDCHPTNDKGFWNPESFDRERLPLLMKNHPFYDLEKIE